VWRRGVRDGDDGRFTLPSRHTFTPQRKTAPPDGYGHVVARNNHTSSSEAALELAKRDLET